MTATNKTPKLTIEVADLNDQETNFILALQEVLKNTVTDDCRRTAPAIRILASLHGLEMVVGCGGSHVWIHRRSQFIDGQHPHQENIRFAIITD